MNSLILTNTVNSLVIDDDTNTTLQIQSNDLSIVEVAEQGPPGPQGANGDKNYTQDFSPTNSLSITHNLGKYPAVSIIDTAGDEVEGGVTYNSLNSLTVLFSAPFGGKITCN